MIKVIVRCVALFSLCDDGCFRSETQDLEPAWMSDRTTREVKLWSCTRVTTWEETRYNNSDLPAGNEAFDDWILSILFGSNYMIVLLVLWVLIPQGVASQYWKAAVSPCQRSIRASEDWAVPAEGEGYQFVTTARVDLYRGEIDFTTGQVSLISFQMDTTILVPQSSNKYFCFRFFLRIRKLKWSFNILDLLLTNFFTLFWNNILSFMPLWVWLEAGQFPLRLNSNFHNIGILLYLQYFVQKRFELSRCDLTQPNYD